MNAIGYVIKDAMGAVGFSLITLLTFGLSTLLMYMMALVYQVAM